MKTTFLQKENILNSCWLVSKCLCMRLMFLESSGHGNIPKYKCVHTESTCIEKKTHLWSTNPNTFIENCKWNASTEYLVESWELIIFTFSSCPFCFMVFKYILILILEFIFSVTYIQWHFDQYFHFGLFYMYRFSQNHASFT